MPSVALINDTSLYESHFGCELVGQTFREQFARTGIELRYALGRDWDLDQLSHIIEGVDLVVVNGEGSIHHGKRQKLLDISSRFPSVLVNCVYQQNPTNDNLGKFLYRSARESLSAGAIKAEGYQCDTVPDLLYASTFLRSFVKKEPSFDLGYTDSVKRQRIGIGPLRIKRSYGFRPDKKTPAQYLQELSSYKRLCIGRFHALVAASVLEIPFCAWESNTWKINGLLQDMGMTSCYYKTFSEAKENTPTNFDPKIKQFSNQAQQRIHAMFDNIARIAHENT